MSSGCLSSLSTTVFLATWTTSRCCSLLNKAHFEHTPLAAPGCLRQSHRITDSVTEAGCKLMPDWARGANGLVSKIRLTFREGKAFAFVYYNHRSAAEDAIKFLHQSYKMRVDAASPIRVRWGNDRKAKGG